MNTLFLLFGMMFVWVCYGATIVGLGALFLSLVYRKALLSFSCCFWIGLALLVTALQIVNLFCGINLFVVRSICFLGLLSFWLFRVRLDVTFWTRLKLWHKFLAVLAISGSQIDLSQFRPCTIRGCTTLIRCGGLPSTRFHRDSGISMED